MWFFNSHITTASLNFSRSFLTIFACLILTECYCQTSSVSGSVLDITTQKPIAGANVNLLSKITEKNVAGLKNNSDSAYKTVAAVTTDTSGTFIFQNINWGQYSLSCFYKMNSEKMFLKLAVFENFGRNDIDTNFNVQQGKNYVHTFYLMVACPYDKTKDLDYCPNCTKKDMVQPILWGLPVLDDDGNWLSGKNIDDYYLGGCEPDIWCNPTKHCNRCNIDF